jgi:hypothetical protein
MNTYHPIEPATRTMLWTAMVLLAVAVTACGGSTQTTTGTAPSIVAPLASASDGAGTLDLLKEGKGKAPKDDDDDSGEPGRGHGRGQPILQIEGFTTSIHGDCPNLTIVINNATVITVGSPDATEFQRATCAQIKAAGNQEPVHLHIAAKRQDDDSLVAASVRMQGPRVGHGDDDDDDED